MHIYDQSVVIKLSNDVNYFNTYVRNQLKTYATLVAARLVLCQPNYELLRAHLFDFSKMLLRATFYEVTSEHADLWRHITVPYRKTIYLLFRLKHWGRDTMAVIFQPAFSNAFFLNGMKELRLRFHWDVFPMVKLTIFHHCFRYRFGAGQAARCVGTEINDISTGRL